ncbi:MAG: hypothetical protein WBW51_04170 [Methyloceanibacter sp.]
MISRTLSVCLAAASFAFLIGAPAPASAGPGVVAAPEAGAALVQEAGYYNRRWRYRNGSYVRAPFTEVDTRRGTWVAAPFARVYSGPRGTWVRAPFVNLWAPR